MTPEVSAVAHAVTVPRFQIELINNISASLEKMELLCDFAELREEFLRLNKRLVIHERWSRFSAIWDVLWVFAGMVLIWVSDAPAALCCGIFVMVGRAVLTVRTIRRSEPKRAEIHATWEAKQEAFLRKWEPRLADMGRIDRSGIPFGA